MTRPMQKQGKKMQKILRVNTHICNGFQRSKKKVTDLQRQHRDQISNGIVVTPEGFASQ